MRPALAAALLLLPLAARTQPVGERPPTTPIKAGKTVTGELAIGVPAMRPLPVP